jgi:hypothetical protein
MDLIYRGVLIPETKLMIGNEISFNQEWNTTIVGLEAISIVVTRE